uniref:cytidine and dCMP deaminase domain-containing protein 1 isoform X1 n=2 Tax=Myxine glutinosa TaxID=7769 RepID=UPI00358EA92C
MAPVRKESKTERFSLRKPRPRISHSTLHSILSLWMEKSPLARSPQCKNAEVSILPVGLVVVLEDKLLGMFCSGYELHAGQAAIVSLGQRLKDSEVFISRRPCSQCSKLLLNAGVKRLVFWPGELEVSPSKVNWTKNKSKKQKQNKNEKQEQKTKTRTKNKSIEQAESEVEMNAYAVSRMSSSLITACVEPPSVPGLVTSARKAPPPFPLSGDEDFKEREQDECKQLCRDFIPSTKIHRHMLQLCQLPHVCDTTNFRRLRRDMRQTLKYLAAVAAQVPISKKFGFRPFSTGTELSNEEKTLYRHCLVSALLLTGRSEDPKTGVGSVIWTMKDGTGKDLPRMELLATGYNGFVRGASKLDFPRSDYQDNQALRKYKYIIHSEQNALINRFRDPRKDEKMVLFVTKCPCDECMPLIRHAGISKIVTVENPKELLPNRELDYTSFREANDIARYTWKHLPSTKR